MKGVSETSFSLPLDRWRTRGAGWTGEEAEAAWSEGGGDDGSRVRHHSKRAADSDGRCALLCTLHPAPLCALCCFALASLFSSHSHSNSFSMSVAAASLAAPVDTAASASAAPAAAPAASSSSAAAAAAVVHCSALPSGQRLHSVYLRGLTGAQFKALKAQAGASQLGFALIKAEMVRQAQGWSSLAVRPNAVWGSQQPSHAPCLVSVACSCALTFVFVHVRVVWGTLSWSVCSKWSAPPSAPRCSRCATSSNPSQSLQRAGLLTAKSETRQTSSTSERVACKGMHSHVSELLCDVDWSVACRNIHDELIFNLSHTSHVRCSTPPDVEMTLAG